MNLFKSSLYNFITLIGLFIIGFFSNVLIIKLIGPEGKGILSIFSAFFGIFVSIGFLSLGSGLIYYTNTIRKPTEYFSSSLFYSVIITITLIIIALGGAKFFLHSFFQGMTENYFYLGVALLFISILVKPTIAFARAMHDTKAYNLSLFLNKIVYIIVLIIIFILKLEITAFHIILILAFASLFNISYLLFKYSKYIHLNSISITPIKNMLKYSLKEHIGVIAQKLNLRIDILIMSIFLNSEEIGYYAIAVLFAELIWYIPNSISVFLFPKISSYNNKVDSAIYTARINRFNFITTILISLIILLVSKYFIILFFGSDFLISYNVLKVLTIGTIMFGNTKILTKYYSGIGKPIMNTYGALIGMIINIPALLILVPKYGVYGSAIATSVSYTVLSIFFIIHFKYKEYRKSSIFDILVIKPEDYKIIVNSTKKLLKVKL
jgi:O-antigen/teichoic acid export membrane protein